MSALPVPNRMSGKMLEIGGRQPVRVVASLLSDREPFSDDALSGLSPLVDSAKVDGGLEWTGAEREQITSGALGTGSTRPVLDRRRDFGVRPCPAGASVHGAHQPMLGAGLRSCPFVVSGRRSVPVAKYGRQPLILSDRIGGLSLLAGDGELSRSGVPAQLNVKLSVGGSWLRRSGSRNTNADVSLSIATRAVAATRSG